MVFIHMLEEENKFFKKNLPEFIKKYHGKFLIIHKNTISDPYNTFQEALAVALSEYKIGEFLIQQCVEDRPNENFFFNSYVETNGC